MLASKIYNIQQIWCFRRENFYLLSIVLASNFIMLLSVLRNYIFSWRRTTAIWTLDLYFFVQNLWVIRLVAIIRSNTNNYFDLIFRTTFAIWETSNLDSCVFLKTWLTYKFYFIESAYIYVIWLDSWSEIQLTDSKISLKYRYDLLSHN